jgi:hypothetical protein
MPPLPKPRGAIPLDFTDTQRALVRALAAEGIPYASICNHIINPETRRPITVPTLTRRFEEELREGSKEGDRLVTRSLAMFLVGRPAEYLMGADGNPVVDSRGTPVKTRDEVRPNVAAAIFLSKVRPGLGFRETTTVEHVTPPETEIAEELRNFTYEEKKKLRDMLRRVNTQRAVEEEEPAPAALTPPPAPEPEPTDAG